MVMTDFRPKIEIWPLRTCNSDINKGYIEYFHGTCVKRPYFHFQYKIWCHHHVPRPRSPVRRGFGNSTMNKGYIADFSLHAQCILHYNEEKRSSRGSVIKVVDAHLVNLGLIHSVTGGTMASTEHLVKNHTGKHSRYKLHNIKRHFHIYKIARAFGN